MLLRIRKWVQDDELEGEISQLHGGDFNPGNHIQPLGFKSNDKPIAVKVRSYRGA